MKGCTYIMIAGAWRERHLSDSCLDCSAGSCLPIAYGSFTPSNCNEDGVDQFSIDANWSAAVNSIAFQLQDDAGCKAYYNDNVCKGGLLAETRPRASQAVTGHVRLPARHWKWDSPAAKMPVLRTAGPWRSIQAPSWSLTLGGGSQWRARVWLP